MPKLYAEPNDTIMSYMIFFEFAIHKMDRIDVTASCMIFGESMCFLKPLYRDCVGMASYVHNGTHSSSVHGKEIDSWSRDATSSSIIAHLISELHLHFCFPCVSLCPTLSLWLDS